MGGRAQQYNETELEDHGLTSRILGVNALRIDEGEERLNRAARIVATLWPLLVLAQISGLAVAFYVAGWVASTPMVMALAAAACCDAAIIASRVWISPRRMWPGTILLGQLALAVAGAVLFRIALAQITGLQTATDILLNITIQFSLMLVASAILMENRFCLFAYSLAMALTILVLTPWSPLLSGLMTFLPFMALTLVMGNREDSQKQKGLANEERAQERAVALLTDFEQSGYGWFWETDRSGRLVYVSKAVAHRLGMASSDLAGRQLSALVVSDRDDSNAENRTLGFHLSARSAFRELAVQAKIEGEEELWWSLSGNPVINDLGHFQGFRGIGTDLTAMKRSQQENTQLARYDTLTGLANRLHIKELLEKALVSASGHPQPCALFMLDLDKFKQVNDTLGHPVGDLLLQQVGKRLSKTVGDKGTVGRLGGDEFQVVLPQMTKQEELEALARSVIVSLSKPYSLNGNQVVIGASIGISIYQDGPVDTAALIRNADLALYAAKSAGRGVARFYKADMHEMAAERQQIEDELRVALQSGQFELAYQPVVDVSSEKISGFEALLRWNHPRLGRYSPANFVPIAEEAGMITSIGEWVLRTACEEAARWPGTARVAVNVSPPQFTDPSFVTSVIYALSSSGLAPERLELEITEGIFLNESAETVKIFDKLKQLGVRLALDDFGTGYSALGYLKKAPFDKIKIDQSFVRGAAKPGSINSAIITSIVSLAESLNMETTAEGAETHDELHLVRSLGCSHIQGYIYGKPMPNAEVAPLLESHDGFAKAIGFARSREKRQLMIRKAALVFDDYCYEGRIRNLSSQGAMVEGLWNVPVGTVFQVQLADRIMTEATVRWSTENQIGLHFAKSIDVAKLAKAPRLDVREGPVKRASDSRAGLVDNSQTVPLRKAG